MDNSVSLLEFIDYFKYDIITGSDVIKEKVIEVHEISRPGVELLGYHQYNNPKRIILLGNKETAFISTLDNDKKIECYQYLTNEITPCIVLTQGRAIDPLLLEIALKKRFVVLSNKKETSLTQVEIINYLSERLAQSTSIHATLVQVYSTGVLLLGRSGIGKSEIALELIRKGHRLVADDRVEILNIRRQLFGTARDSIAKFMEIRGLGLFDVTKILGINSYTKQVKIDFAIRLIDDNVLRERVIRESSITFFDESLTSVDIPVMPGRDMAAIVEMAVTLMRLKENGYNPEEEFRKKVFGEECE